MSELTRVPKLQVVPVAGDRVITDHRYHARFEGRVCAVFDSEDGDRLVVVRVRDTRGVYQILPQGSLLRITDDVRNAETRVEPYTAQMGGNG